MNYRELKRFCDEKIKSYPELQKRYKKEIIVAKRFYDNDRNLYEEFIEKKEKIDKRYIIPFLLGLTEEVIDKNPEYIQVKPGASGGIDIDSDFAPQAKEKVTEYLKNKFGEDRVVSVGTYSRMGISSAAKDLLRIYKVDFKESNAFTSSLDSNASWEDNISKIKGENPQLYSFYLKHQKILDIVPKLINKVRQTGKHAGGVVVLDQPVYELIPIERVTDVLVSAFPESAQHQVLDELGVIKFDLLGISILDVVSNAVDSIDEKIYLIEDDDGIIKVVDESYINKEIEKLWKMFGLLLIFI